MENPFREEHDILNGKYKLVTEENEFRMSHWVKGFGIIESESGNSVLELIRSFDLASFEEVGDILEVHFRVYPNGATRYTVGIDPAKRTFSYNNETISLDKLSTTFAG